MLRLTRTVRRRQQIQANHSKIANNQDLVAAFISKL
jgi:hypothetical protein